MLEGNRCHELLANQLVPWRDETDGGYHNRVEENADGNGHPDGTNEMLATEVGARFFRGLAYGFESGHEIRHDLNDQQNRNQWGMRKQGREVARRTPARTQRHKYDEERESAKAGPILKHSAQADAAVIQHGEKRRKAESDRKMRKENGAPGNAVE